MSSSLKNTFKRIPENAPKIHPSDEPLRPHGQEFDSKGAKRISEVLDANPGVLDPVCNDLVKTSRSDTGRQGMTAEQVLRSAVLKQYRELTYEEPAFHIEGSDAFRTFARLEMGQHPSKSVLQENNKAISDKAWEAIHNEIL